MYNELTVTLVELRELDSHPDWLGGRKGAEDMDFPWKIKYNVK